MTDLNVLQTLLVGHIWQSVALAGLLAAVLIFGKRMPGASRYALSGAAFLAAIALPLAAFIPGESLVRTVMNQIHTAEEQVLAPATPEQGTSPLAREVADNAIATWATNYAARAVDEATNNGAIPLSETEFGKAAVAEGAPAFALNMGGNVLQSLTTPQAVVAPPAPKPAFTFPEFKLPDMNIPDLTLPLLLVWAAGALFLLVRTGRDLIAVERLVARARPIELPEALKRRMGDIRVAVSAEAPGPMAAGFFKPCIVLPESIALASPGMAALLEHERAHIERNDMLVALMQRIAVALLWWSPALHWISRRVDEEREVACDECAVERTGDARAFARSLTKQAENQLWARAPRLAVGAIGPRSQVGRRIKRLIEIAKGAAPAKYAGRLAFAGLALAVAVAAMVTPRFSADAQQSKDLPPFDGSLAGGPNNENKNDVDNDIWQRASRDDLDGGVDHDFSSLSGDIDLLMQQLGGELEMAFAGLSPELEGELAGLSAEMATLGAEISMLVSQEIAQEMPQVMEEVRRSLAEEGIIVSDWDDLHELTGYDQQELREALQEARDEIRQELGPEMRAEIRAAIDEARAELSEHREEIRAAMEHKRANMEVAREAMAKARAEIDAARARGDFKRLRELDIEPQVLEKLRELNIDIDLDDVRVHRIKGDDSSSAERLFRAAGRGDLNAVRSLINNDKVNVNTVLHGDGTALIAAARRGQTDVVRFLLNAGADPNLKSDGDGNPLIAAAHRGHLDIAKMLVERGANVNGAVSGDGNPLIAAAQQGELDVAKYLIAQGAKVNGYVEGDETPLMNAAEQGELDMVKLLVEKGANVNLAYRVDSWWDGDTREELRSPLSQAQKHGRDDVASYLRSKGAVAAPKPAN